MTSRAIQILTTMWLPLFALAQGVDVRGVVTDSTTGERIPFANILILDVNRGAGSNLQGFYLIANVPLGRYKIRASSIGYETRTMTVEVSGTQAVAVNFRLPPKPVEFSEVMVTDVAKHELTDIHTSVHVLEQRDIHSVPSAVQDDIFRSITILPGVVSTSDVNSQFYVRGGAGDQNLILLDGMRIYNPYHAFGIFSVFDADIIKTTEVYTGAFPPEFGDRLSSVVNMTTKDGGLQSVSGRANINFISTKVEADGPAAESVSWLINGRKSMFSDTFSKFLNKDLPLSFYDAFAKVTVHSADFQSKYGLQGFFSGDDLKSGNPTQPDYHWRTSAIGFVASGLIQDRVYVNAVAFGNSFEAERDAESSTDVTPASTSVKETGVRANATIYTDNHGLFFFGFEFNFPVLDYTVTNNFGVRTDQTSSSVEAASWIRYQTPPSRLQADLGLYFDFGRLMSRNGGIEVLQPRLNISYGLWDTWKAKLAFGRFTQSIITVNNEDDVIPIFDAWIQVPEELKVEQADHYVAGLEGNLSRNLSTSFQTYYKYYSSLVLYNRDKVDALDPDYIGGKGEAYGLESLVRYSASLLDLYAAYTLGWTSVTASGVTYYPRYDRRHTVNLLTVIHALDRMDVTFRWEFGSGFPFTQTMGYYDRLGLTDLFRGTSVGETGKPYAVLGNKDAARLPDYHRLDASVTYRFTLRPITGNVGINIVNLYDHKNIFYFDRKTGQEIDMLPFFPTATLTIEL